MNILTLGKRLVYYSTVVAIAVVASAVEGRTQTITPTSYTPEGNPGNDAPLVDLSSAEPSIDPFSVILPSGVSVDDIPSVNTPSINTSIVNKPSAAVPEPASTAGLLLFGAFGTATLIKRKQKLSTKV